MATKKNSSARTKVEAPALPATSIAEENSLFATDVTLPQDGQKLSLNVEAPAATTVKPNPLAEAQAVVPPTASKPKLVVAANPLAEANAAVPATPRQAINPLAEANAAVPATPKPANPLAEANAAVPATPKPANPLAQANAAVPVTPKPANPLAEANAAVPATPAPVKAGTSASPTVQTNATSQTSPAQTTAQPATSNTTQIIVPPVNAAPAPSRKPAAFTAEDISTIRATGTDGQPNDRRILEIAAEKAGHDINDKNDPYYLEPGKEYSIPNAAFSKYFNLVDSGRPKHIEQNLEKATAQLFASKRDVLSTEQLQEITKLKELAASLKGADSEALTSSFKQIHEVLKGQGVSSPKQDRDISRLDDKGEVTYVKSKATKQLLDAVALVEKRQVLGEAERSKLLAAEHALFEGYDPKALAAVAKTEDQQKSAAK